MSTPLIYGIASLAVALSVFLILAFRFPDVVSDFFAGISEVDISVKGFKIRRALRTAGQAVHEKEQREPDREALKRDFSSFLALPLDRRVLWVDDNPSNNAYEIETLERLGITVDAVESNSEAETAAKHRQYNLIISDIGRATPELPTAGLDLPRSLSHIIPVMPQIVYYVRKATSPKTPVGFPVTDKPTELFSLVIAALTHDQPWMEAD